MRSKIIRIVILLIGIVYALQPCCYAREAAQDSKKTRVIPPSNIAEEVGLRLNPCLDAHVLYGSDVDADTLQQFTDARNSLPPGACSDPLLVEKIFRVRFLRYALIALIHDPWNLEKKIAIQEQAINQCQDVRCFEHELNSAIAALIPLYLNAPDPKWPSGSLCSTKPAKALLSALTRKAREEIAYGCGGVGPESVVISSCNDSHGKLVSAGCTMQGNQVNTPEWLFREKKAEKKLLLYTDNGPLGTLQTTCNGMPDLLTIARINAGARYHTYYRFDGSIYQSVYGYTLMSVGNGNFPIAWDGGGIQNTVACR